MNILLRFATAPLLFFSPVLSSSATLVLNVHRILTGVIRDRSPRRLLLGGIALFFMHLSAIPSSAAVIALYPFGTVSSNTSPSTDVDPDSSATTIAAGAGVTMTASGTGVPGPSGAMLGATAINEADAVSGNDYFEFSINPNSGYEMSLVSLTLQYMRSGPTGTTNMIVRSSLDSYGSNLFTDTTTGSFKTGTLTLSSLPAFQDLDSPVTFRFYAWGATDGSLRFDNVTLEGDLNAIPEPSTSLLTLIALSTAVFVRRVKKGSLSFKN